MFNLDQAIARWRLQMADAGVETTESLNELEAHLRDDIDHAIRSGLSAELAFQGASERLGRADALRGEFAKWARAKRQHFICRGVISGIGVFLLGATFCYFVMIPAMLAASQLHSQWYGFSLIQWKTDIFVWKVIVWKVMLGLSLGFEVPVVILTLVKIGVIDYRLLSKARKYVIIVNFVLGAVLTNPEVIIQLVMFLPLQMLYEFSVWVVWYWERQAKKRAGVENGLC